MPAKKLSGKSGGRSRLLTAIITLAIIGGILFGLYLLFSKSGILTKTVASLPKITKPIPDMSRARQLTINPNQESVMQVYTKEKILITLLIPKGALEKVQTIKMIPYYYDEKKTDPTAGVLISPGSLTFKVPVTLFFDLSNSKLRTDAPLNKNKAEFRINGTSQVLMFDQNASELIPALIAREVETSTQLRARILTGGGYVISVDGKDQKRWAENAISKKKISAISTLEAAKVLLSDGVNLSSKEKAKVGASAAKILAKPQPPAHEFVAALAVMQLLESKKTGLIRQAFAQEGYIPAQRPTPRGVIEYMCKKSNNLPVESYVAFAAAAWKYGYGDLRDRCMTIALNKAADEAKRLLSDPNATIKDMLIAMKNIQFLGMDDLTDLDQKLYEKIKFTAEKEAKKVAYDIDATPVQVAVELQKLQVFGVEGRTNDILTERMNSVLDDIEKRIPTPPPADYDEESSYSDEQILVDQAWTIIGIELLKTMGITEFDEASLKKKFSEMTDAVNMMNEAFLPACIELGGENCEETYSEAKKRLEDNLRDGYRVAEDIGSTQNEEFEAPDYDDGNARYYFELTPTPEEEYYEGEKNDTTEQPSEEVQDNVNLEDTTVTQESQSDDPKESDQEEEVQGAHSTNYLKILIDAVKSAFKK